jgi:hypothetical protein
MQDVILMALGEKITGISRQDWEQGLAAIPGHVAASLSFMTPGHHRVRNFAVRELPHAGSPLAPDFIAGSLNMTVAEVNATLEELERHMTFLFRNEAGAVSWAYPVTVDATPHRVSFDTGERLFAA